MSDKLNVGYDIDVNGGNFEAVSLDDFVKQMEQLQQDGWEICYIKAFIGVKRDTDMHQDTIASQQ